MKGRKQIKIKNIYLVRFVVWYGIVNRGYNKVTLFRFIIKKKLNIIDLQNEKKIVFYILKPLLFVVIVVVIFYSSNSALIKLNKKQKPPKN